MKQKIINPTYGADFEMFVRDIRTKEVVPVPLAFGGTKEKPLSIGNNCFRQIDNVCVEMNIPVVTTLEEWIEYYQYCIEKANEILLPLGLETTVLSSHIFRENQLEERHMEFGCSKSTDPYTTVDNRPDPFLAGNMRTSGAHIHVGFNGGLTFDEMRRFMFCMDKLVGIPGLEYCADDRRRSLYGKAGDFRFKTLKDITILEYRSLGGAFVTEKGIPFMFNNTQKAIELFNSGYTFSEEELITQQNKINECLLTTV